MATGLTIWQPNANFSYFKANFAHTNHFCLVNLTRQGWAWTCKGKVLRGERPVLALSSYEVGMIRTSYHWRGITVLSFILVDLSPFAFSRRAAGCVRPKTFWLSWSSGPAWHPLDLKLKLHQMVSYVTLRFIESITLCFVVWITLIILLFQILWMCEFHTTCSSAGTGLAVATIGAMGSSVVTGMMLARSCSYLIILIYYQIWWSNSLLFADDPNARQTWWWYVLWIHPFKSNPYPLQIWQ